MIAELINKTIKHVGLNTVSIEIQVGKKTVTVVKTPQDLRIFLISQIGVNEKMAINMCNMILEAKEINEEEIKQTNKKINKKNKIK